MRDLLRIAAVIVVVLVGITQVRSCLMTDADRVIALIEDCQEGWNDASAGRTVAPLGDDFTLHPYNQGKPWLRGVLFQIFRSDRDPETREFNWTAEIEWDSLELEFVDEDATHAQVRGQVTLTHRVKGPTTGGFGVVARKSDGEWRIVAAAFQGLGTAGGRQPRDRTLPLPRDGSIDEIAPRSEDGNSEDGKSEEGGD